MKNINYLTLTVLVGFLSLSAMGADADDHSLKEMGYSSIPFVSASSTSDLEYEIVNNQVRITAYTGNDPQVVIPAEIEGLPVTTIGYPGFRSNTEVKSISLPDGLLHLEGHCFYKCTNLFNITLPKTVTDIGDFAFGGCTSLTSIFIPASVKEMGDHVFFYCPSMKEVQVEESNVSYSSKEGVLFNKEASMLLFYPGASPRTSYQIPSEVSTLAAFAFESCINLKALTFSETMEEISISSLASCNSLESVKIPDSVKRIGPAAFGRCSNLQKITLGNSLVEIEELAFLGCSSLQELIFPSSLKRFQRGAFSECTGLRDLYFKGNIPTTSFDESPIFDASLPIVHYVEGTLGWKGEYLVNTEGERFDLEETSTLLRPCNWWTGKCTLQTWTLPADEPEVFISQKTRKDDKVGMTLVFGGVLQSSSDLKNWETVATQSPYQVSEPVTAGRKFYRAKAQE